ncbi:hypothetical protein CMI41_04190 [Candidatus Pacearchaeota archaeon]|nr:hypothetical protein [Candidatus Pacearchaeota archaeon]|tara:strand:- start:2987 stop:3673 length:687 start_codon:yes stop_codon:yes gene_type:complete
MKKRLILFDIDGILIKGGGVGMTTKNLKKYFNLDIGDLGGKYDAEGKTYRRILAEILEALGIKEPEGDSRFLDALHDAGPLREAIRDGKTFEKINGAEDLVKKLLSFGHVVGLLTGNTFEMARLKLEAVGLWKYFNVGAFGGETKIRGELVDIGMKDAEDKTSIKFDKKDVFIIGDTILDIECARHGGVMAIAVATGNDSVEKLKSENPDYLFSDFSKISDFLEIVNG